MFNPTVGVFTTEDPEGFVAGDDNLHRFVGNDPMNDTDPTGMADVSVSVQEEIDNGDFAKNATKNPTKPIVPLSITMTEAGKNPAITTNNGKSNQDDGRVNENPWLGRGGDQAKVGDQFMGGFVNLEWKITFSGNPRNCTWGRTIVTWVSQYKDGNGIKIVHYYDKDPRRDDTDHQNEYIVGNNVYMYDAPGRAVSIPYFAPRYAYLFEIWAKSSDGKKTLSEWYYVDPNSGKYYSTVTPDFESILYPDYTLGGVSPG